MVKVLIVSPCVNLPVPAVQGGAVSTLIEYLVAENETQQKMNLTVLSIYNADAVEKSREYPSTRFEFIRSGCLVDILDKCLDTVLSVVKRKKQSHQYIKKQNSLWYIYRYLKANDFDKVVFQNSGFLLNVLKNKKICEQYKGKLYYHLHNDIPESIYVPGVKKCTLLLVSEYLKKNINRVCGQDMSGQCKIVKNGFDCDHFAQPFSSEEKRDLKMRLGIDLNKKILMFAGRIAQSKGIDELTDAVIRSNRDDIVLMVVGSHNFGTGQTSAFQKKMENKFAKLGKKVCFTGFVPYWDMWKYYKIADVAILPSVWEEPAGLTMIEACAAGVPLITTRSGGIPEYIESKYSVILNNDEKIVDNIEMAINDVLSNMEDRTKKAHCAMRLIRQRYNLKNYYVNFVKSIS